MKKLLVVGSIVTTLFSCKNNTQQEADKPQQDSLSAPTAMNDGHNANNSLDYQGTYSDTLPSASGSGMIVTITLEKTTYVKKTQYVGKTEIYEDKGQYTWNTAGNTVILAGLKNEPNQYFVGENTLTQLDMEGNKITGNLADEYILKKVQP